MRFTTKEEIRSKGKILEAGNTFDAEVQGFTKEDVMRWYAAGFCEVEGLEPAPERNPQGQVVRPENAAHTQTTE